MSRIALIIGLVLSGALHLALFRCAGPVRPRADAIAQVLRAEVVEIQNRTEPEPLRASDPALPSDPPPPEPYAEPDPTQQQLQQRRERAPAEPAPAPLERVVEPVAAPSEFVEPGDLAGTPESPDVSPIPELRIDWGSEDTAKETLRKGDLKLAILGGTEQRSRISAEIRWDGCAWRREPFRAEPGVRYSNRLRVVDEVPAFRGARRGAGLGPGERLVVLLPSGVERLLESAQLTTAFGRGLAMEDVRRFGGRFTSNGPRIGFEVTRVQVRRDSK